MDSHTRLFNRIAFAYQWFFKRQVSSYKDIIFRFNKYLDLHKGADILDIGCGTGAFAYSLKESGYNVTGVDAASAMIEKAKKNNVYCLQGDVVEGLNFSDNSFDLVVASYVVHGLDREGREEMFKEAARISRNKVIFHDYNKKRNFFIDVIEYLEGGGYFSFVENGVSEMEQVFESVKVVPIGAWNAWYICSGD